MIENIVLHDDWSEDEKKYLDKRLIDLDNLSIKLANGCLIHKTSTDENPIKTIGISMSFFDHDHKEAFSDKERDKITMSCHRFITLCVFGTIALYKITRHKCKIKGCYAPIHIELGTHVENALDRHRDGTSGAILTEEDVKEIYENKDNLTPKELGEMYDVAESTISAIFVGQNWNHITELEKTRIKHSREESQEYAFDNTQYFLNKIEGSIKVDEETGCWEWQKGRHNGYGSISILGNSFGTHSVMWSLINRYFPNIDLDELIRHLCNNKCCCNPLHLAFGNRRLNALDMQRFGEKCVNATLTNVQVLEIDKLLKEGKSNAEIARLYNVNHRIISNIKVGVHWTKVTGRERVFSEVVIPMEKAANIKFILNLGVFTYDNIAEVFNISASSVRDINLVTDKYKKLEPLLTEEGRNVLENLKQKYPEFVSSIDESKGLINTIHTPKHGIAKKANIGDIKLLLMTTKYNQPQIAECYNTTSAVIGTIHRGVTFGEIEPNETLSEQGEKILETLIEKFGDKRITKDLNVSEGNSSTNPTETKFENEKMKDTKKKGRRLTKEQIRDIKLLSIIAKYSQRQLAECYNIDRTTIGFIQRGERHGEIEANKELSEEGKAILKMLIEKYGNNKIIKNLNNLEEKPKRKIVIRAHKE